MVPDSPGERVTAAYGMPASRHPWRAPERYRVRHVRRLSGKMGFRYFADYQQARDFAIVCDGCEVERQPDPRASRVF